VGKKQEGRKRKVQSKKERRSGHYIQKIIARRENENGRRKARAGETGKRKNLIVVARGKKIRG